MAVVESGTGATDSASSVSPHIRYPAAVTLIALDPDLPTGSQRVMVEAAPARSDLRWRLDGATLANTDSRGRADWTPAAGKDTLALVDLDGRTLATVAFEVRGNTAP